MYNRLSVGLIVGAFGWAMASQAGAVTVGDITSALDANYSAISDISADFTIESDVNDHDVTEGWCKAKQAGSSKFRVNVSSPGTLDIYCDGTNVSDMGYEYSKENWVSWDMHGFLSRPFREGDIVWILDHEQFTLLGGTVAINGVTCYRISSTNYIVYVDSSEYAKVMRIERKVSGNVVRRYTFDDYSFVEDTAWVAATCVGTDAPGDNTETVTVQFSNININEDLDDSYFQLP